MDGVKSTHLNQSLNTALGKRRVSRSRPDVVSVANSNTINVHELVSRSQTVKSQTRKAQAIAEMGRRSTGARRCEATAASPTGNAGRGDADPNGGR